MLPISVIIPASGRSTLFRTIESLANQSLDATQFETIVILDGPASQIASRLEQDGCGLNLRVFEQPRSGAASARNKGAKEARGELLIFLDDDVAATRDLLSQYWFFTKEHPEQPALLFGSVPVDPASPATFLRRLIEKRQKDFFEKCDRGADTAPSFFCSANFAILRSDFWRAGGFDEAFAGYGWEEADFGVRLRDLGYDFVYLKSASAVEFYEKDLQKAAGMYAYETGRNEVLFLKKHPKYRGALQLQKMFLGKPLYRIFARLAWSLPAVLNLMRLLLFGSSHRYRMRYLLSFWSGVKASGIDRNQLRRLFARKVVVLCYHDIFQNTDTLFDVSLSAFQRQMKRLKESGYHAISLSSYLEWLDNGTDLPEKCVILTFDDGYKNFHSLAADVLRAAGFTAEIFICPMLAGKENAWDFPTAAQHKALMDWNEIKELHPQFHFSAHSLTHSDLRKLPCDEARREIRDSRRLIMERVEEPRAFAYPFGAASETLRAMVAEAGYRCAFTTDEGKNTVTTDRYLLKRVVIDRWDAGPLFAFKLRNGRSFFPSGRSAFRKMRLAFRKTSVQRSSLGQEIH